MKINRFLKISIITINFIILLSLTECLLSESNNTIFLSKIRKLSNNSKIAEEILMHKTHSNDRKFLPYTYPITEESQKTPANENKYFQPIRINFVHVDGKISKNWKSSFNEETYRKFMSIVMNPVNDYLKKIIKVYPLSGNVNVVCKDTMKDKHNKPIVIKENIGKFVKDFVSKLAFNNTFK